MNFLQRFFEVPSDLQNTWWGLILWQLQLTLVPVLIGLALALPLGMLCARFRWFYPPVLGVTTIFYAIPSLAFFVFLIDYTGETSLTVEIPLTVYTLVVLVPAIVDGMRSVSEDTRAAATAMGFGTLRRYLQVELPIAVPAIIAGLRVATVSSVSLVSVGMLIGNEGALGNLLSDALNYHRPLLAWDAVLTIAVLGVVLDGLLVLARRILTPWARKAASA
ncbi:ABC transporter permease [Streptacidiphilus sp. MAP5-3]|uniref:ABC transporter permease n=1 Tax=unclassified Streptacidiphilus TaxID=2643834 RepID=UPI003519397B